MKIPLKPSAGQHVWEALRGPQYSVSPPAPLSRRGIPSHCPNHCAREEEDDKDGMGGEGDSTSYTKWIPPLQLGNWWGGAFIDSQCL